MDPKTRAALGLLAALILAAIVLRWGLRRDGRPWFYRGRHRAPDDTGPEHKGATEDWSPAGDVEAAEPDPEPPHMSLAAVLEEVTDEQLHVALEVEHIRAEVRAELDSVWAGPVADQLIRARMACAGVEARLLASAGVPRRRATWDEPTGSFSRRELRAALADEAVTVG